MVNQYNAQFALQDTTNDVQWLKPVSVFVPVHSPIMRGAVHRHRTMMTFKLYADERSVGIGGYGSYLRENTDDPSIDGCGGFSLPFICALETYATRQGELDGIEFASTVLELKFRAWWYKQSGAQEPETVSLRGKIYRRASGGGETFLVTVSQMITTTAKNYSRSVTLTQVFNKGDRLVVKWSVRFTGLGGG